MTNSVFRHSSPYFLSWAFPGLTLPKIGAVKELTVRGSKLITVHNWLGKKSFNISLPSTSSRHVQRRTLAMWPFSRN